MASKKELREAVDALTSKKTANTRARASKKPAKKKGGREFMRGRYTPNEKQVDRLLAALGPLEAGLAYYAVKRARKVDELLAALGPFEAGLAYYAFENNPSSATMSGKNALKSIGHFVDHALNMGPEYSNAARVKTGEQLENLYKAMLWAKSAGRP
jgi:hypothetical protein